MAIRYEIAGEDVTLVLPLLIDGDGTTADDGTVAIKLRDHIGAIVYADTISLSEDATEFLFSVAAHLNEKTRAFERRTITYRWTASGRPASRTVTYVLADYVAMDATPDMVRERLGVSRAELADAEIDLLGAYHTLADTLGGTALADRLASGTTDMLRANRAIVLTAALSLLPSLRLKAAQAEKSGDESFTRFDIDWDALETALKDEAASSTSSSATGTGAPLFMLSVAPDPLNPWDD